MKLTQHIDRVREGLTEHTVQSKTSHSKVERNPTHIHHWLWKLKMQVRVLLWLELMYQGSKFRSDTHTHTPKAHFSCTMPLTHRTARTQDTSTCRPLSAGVNCYSPQGSLLFLLHRSILFTQDACSALVQICHHKCLLQVDVEMIQDVTVKKGMQRCSIVCQLSKFSVSLCHVTCVQ
jgi:hypothetical protein